MESATYIFEIQRLLSRAHSLLGEPALPLELDWDVERALLKVARHVGYGGLESEPPLLSVISGRGGREFVFGAAEYVLPVEDDREIRLVSFAVPDCNMPNFWAVGESDYRRFYRVLRNLIRAQQATPQPFLSEETRRTLWDNTVGFLKRDNQLLARYNIPKKRGVLLTGDPGNGKTMACRWLHDQCNRRGIAWKSVSMADYECARADRSLRQVFSVREPGIVLFDDFDIALTRRDRGGDQFNQSTFLSELDGVDSKSGVVYLFTTNMQVADIDAAMKRPGRIDVILPFGRPDKEMRQRFIKERWPEEALLAESLAEIVADTEGLSFAELEEARKLYVLKFLDDGMWCWHRTKATLRQANNEVVSRQIGFGSLSQPEEATIPQTAATAKDDTGGESSDLPPVFLSR